MTDQVTTKVCSKCKVDKGFEFFTKDKSRKYGISRYCKECERHIRRQSLINDPEKKKAHNKKWAENNPENKKANGQKWRKENREKELARAKLQYKDNPEKAKAMAKARADRCSDGYVAKRIGIKLSQCTQELIELKRINILITREIRNQQQCQN